MKFIDALIAKAAVFALLLAVAPAATAAEFRHGWQAAQVSGSNRLLLFSLAQERPHGAERVVPKLARHQGLGHGGSGLRILSFGRSVRPIVEYDDNINNGIPTDTIKIGAYDFKVDKDSRARSGMLLGAGAYGVLRSSYARGGILQLSIGTSWREASRENITRRSAFGSLCADQYLRNWSWGEICVGKAYSDEDAAIERLSFWSAGLSRYFTTPAGLHELSLTLRDTQHEDYQKLSFSLETKTAVPRVGAFGLGVDFSERIDGHNTRMYGGSISLTRPFSGRPATAGFTFAREGGGTFLGRAREDDVYGLYVRRDMTKWLSVTLSLKRRHSTLETFDQFEPGISVDLTGWRF